MLRADKAKARAYFESLKPKRRIFDQLDKDPVQSSDPWKSAKKKSANGWDANSQI